MTRPARAVISVQALKHNLRQVRRLAPHSRVMACIKANGYGHGIEPVSRALAETDAFAVACLEEGLAVREAGLSNPVVLLEGVFAGAELPRAMEQDFRIVVHSDWQMDMLESEGHGPVDAWLKIDTGMSRLGFRPEEARVAYERLAACAQVRQPPALMTHLASADYRTDDKTTRQLELFDAITRDLPGERSIANSAGILAWPDSHADWVRPGIMLYGVSPFGERNGEALGLCPAMRVETQLIAVKRLRRGETVGYGGDWVSPRDTTLGVAAIGYGDGYPRHAPSGTPVLVGGRRVPLVGRVSMDMITVDLGPDATEQPGERVVLWGEGVAVEEVARASGTIGYELLCGVTQRVRFDVQE
ncbi:MAG: alanine racemase [Gammaproteobacteria bacterium]|jgi:alanine racemase